MNDVNDPWYANQDLLRQQKWLSMYLRKVNFRPPGLSDQPVTTNRKDFNRLLSRFIGKIFACFKPYSSNKSVLQLPADPISLLFCDAVTF